MCSLAIHILLLWRNIYTNPLCIFLVGLFVFYHWAVSFLCVFWIQVPSQSFLNLKRRLNQGWSRGDHFNSWWSSLAGDRNLAKNSRILFIPRRGFLQGGTLEGKHAELSGQAWACFLFSSVAQSCLTLCDPMDCSTPALPVHHQPPELTQTHVQWVGDAIQPSHLLLSPSPPAFNLSQHQHLFKWVSSWHQVAKILGVSASVLPMNT